MIRSGRPELIDSDGYCLGFTSSRQTQQYVVHSHTYDYNETVKELIQLLMDTGGVPEGFRFSSMQVNSDAKIARHRDRNSAWSLTACFGNFTGGTLMIDEKTVQAFQKLALMDGS